MVWGIRPEHLWLVDAEAGTLRCEILAVETLGSELLLHVACGGHRLIAPLPEWPGRRRQGRIRSGADNTFLTR